MYDKQTDLNESSLHFCPVQALNRLDDDDTTVGNTICYSMSYGLKCQSYLETVS